MSNRCHALPIWLVVLLAIAALTGCGGGNPIVGHWVPASTDVVGFELDLSTDGSASESLSPATGCTGTLSYTGLSWSTTGDTLAITGSATCAGSATCVRGGVSITLGCSASGMSGGLSGSVTYALSSDDDTLTLGASGSGAQVYSRTSP